MRGNRFSRMRILYAFLRRCPGSRPSPRPSPPNQLPPREKHAATTAEAMEGKTASTRCSDSSSGSATRRPPSASLPHRRGMEPVPAAPPSTCMMTWSQTAVENEEFDVALDFLDQVGDHGASLRRRLEPPRHRAFHDAELRQVDGRYQPHAGAANPAISARWRAWGRS